MLDAARNYQSVLEYAPGGNASRDFRQLAQAVIGLGNHGTSAGNLQFFFERMIARPAS